MKPQMSQEEINKIEEMLLSHGKDIDVLEWGSGGSTVYFTNFLRQHGISYTWESVEYNKKWYEKITDALKNDPHTHLELFDVGNDDNKQPNIPMDEYVSYPATLGKKFDIIFVDGRKRRRCALEGASLLKPGGVVILHDARRTYYHCAFKQFPDSRIILFSGLWVGRLAYPGLLQKSINLIRYWCFRLYTFSFRFYPRFR